MRGVLALSLAFGLLAQSASAATLSSDAPCYRPGQPAVFTGLGFTPNGQIDLSPNSTPPVVPTADAAGAFTATLRAPSQISGQQLYTFTATDVSDPAIAASTNVTVTALDVTVRPTSGPPGRKVRIGARGFMGSRTLYAHVVRGGFKRNVEVGRIRGDCGKAGGRKRLLPRGAKSGKYLVQFDGRRRFSRRTPVRVRFTITVFRTFRPSASTAARWTLAR